MSGEGLERFNKKSRPGLLKALAETPFDLLVIGGGITGASILRDAALRGMRVALVEANDFASGTSGRSSKLIHGGLRYIKNLGFRLAWESCHERNLHIRLNKRLVRPLPFLVPLYDGRGDSRAAMRAGMMVYEFLSGFSNHRFHHFLTREETLERAPGIPAEGLNGGCVYYDAVVSDNRWTLEIIKDGVRNGGLALNYAPVTRLLKRDGKTAGAVVEDHAGAKSVEVSARAVVNATGVFTDRIRRMDRADAPPLVRLSKGTHLVFREADVPLFITTVLASPLDGRPLFLVKREGCFLFGTTDDWEETDPGEPVPLPRDVGYLFESLRGVFPDADLGPDKVQFVYSGFRPLLSSGPAGQEPSRATREDLEETSPSGLISIVGGKLTTARVTASRFLDRLIRTLGGGGKWKRCSTDQVSIGGTNEQVSEGLSLWVRKCPKLADYFRILFQRYGVDAHGVAESALRIYLGQHPDPASEPIRAEVEYVCRHEMVLTLGDLIDRRAGFLFWDRERRLERLRYGVLVISEELGLSQKEFEDQYRDYEAYLDRFHSLPTREASSRGVAEESAEK